LTPLVIKKRGPIAKDKVRGPEEGRKRSTRSRTVGCNKCNGLRWHWPETQGEAKETSSNLYSMSALFNRATFILASFNSTIIISAIFSSAIFNSANARELNVIFFMSVFL